ncbi:MAG: hypothetical protein SPH93_02535 [Clostridium sp.]|uniref:hypothetical protein n=1 Tax=Clostridium sp. TaxID=1506 RepID=UPI002A91E0EB|nr:hypothetical protein [Clostridium sp.]MDY6226548.1 hypothetical protein [Clostridium sp.]
MNEIIKDLIILVLPTISLVLSIVAIYQVDINNRNESAYEEMDSNLIDVEIYKVDNSTTDEIYSEKVEIQIFNKDNIEKAYLIYPNNVVKNIDIDEAEEIIEETLNKDIELEIYDFVEEYRFYQYRFLFLIDSEDSYSLYLIYVKKDGEKMIVNAVSGIEVWGLANSNKDNPKYEGERIMAQQYKQILEGSSDYIK